MSAFRKHIAFRIFWFLIGVHLFNCSVDTRDLKPDYVAEDLRINDIETVAELVLEEGLNIKNAMPEHEEHDDGTSHFKALKVYVFNQPEPVLAAAPAAEQPVVLIHRARTRASEYDQYTRGITPPPPKA